MKFHHIGIATSDIEKMLAKLQNFFTIKNVSEIIYDQNQDAYLCMLTLEDGMMIELISGKVVENILKKRQYLYHTCYEVDDINKWIEKISDDGGFLVRDAVDAKLFNNRKVAFLMWDLGLIELVEKEVAL